MESHLALTNGHSPATRRRAWSARLAFALIAAATLTEDPHTSAQQPRWTARLVTQIGDIDGPAALSTVWDLEIGRNGEVFVAQPTTGSILVFSAQGQLLRTIGRKGEGPGEFQTVGRTGWTSDTLWALNFRNINLFTANGAFVRRITPTALPNLGPHITIPTPGPLLADGTIMVIPNVSSGAIANGDINSAPVIRVTQSGTLVDTLAIVSLAGNGIMLNIQGRRSAAQQPYMDAPLWLNTADGQGLVIVDRRVRGQAGTPLFRVIRTNLRGDTVVSRTHQYRRVPMTDQWRNDLIKRLARSRTGNGAVPVECRRA